MQQSQRLNTIKNLLVSNKERELSYINNPYKILGEDKMNYKYFSIIKNKYVGFDILKGVNIYNKIGYKFSFRNLYYYYNNVNFFIKSFINNTRWDKINSGNLITTIFKINNSKLFINSFLDFIDNEKENNYSEQEQIRQVLEDIKKAKQKFDKLFPLTYTINSYISSHIQYYKILKELENQYIIENIKILGGSITFVLSENKEKDILVVFDGENISINGNNIDFKTTNTVVYQVIKLLFQYYKKNKTNQVQYYVLKKFYKDSGFINSNLEKVDFGYEYLRRTIETKSKEIEKKFGINNFLYSNYSGIECKYFKPER